MGFVTVIPEPFIKITPMITGFMWSVKELVFNESITFSISIVDQNDKILQNTHIIVDGEDYKNWSNDDTYIINFICRKLNLTLATPEYLLSLEREHNYEYNVSV